MLLSEKPTQQQQQQQEPAKEEGITRRDFIQKSAAGAIGSLVFNEIMNGKPELENIEVAKAEEEAKFMKELLLDERFRRIFGMSGETKILLGKQEQPVSNIETMRVFLLTAMNKIESLEKDIESLRNKLDEKEEIIKAISGNLDLAQQWLVERTQMNQEIIDMLFKSGAEGESGVGKIKLQIISIMETIERKIEKEGWQDFPEFNQKILSLYEAFVKALQEKYVDMLIDQTYYERQSGNLIKEYKKAIPEKKWNEAKLKKYSPKNLIEQDRNDGRLQFRHEGFNKFFNLSAEIVSFINDLGKIFPEAREYMRVKCQI